MADSEEDLEKILDSALDELEDDTDPYGDHRQQDKEEEKKDENQWSNDKMTTKKKNVKISLTSASADNPSVKELRERMDHLMEELKDPELVESLRETFKILGSHRDGEKTIQEFLESTSALDGDGDENNNNNNDDDDDEEEEKEEEGNEGQIPNEMDEAVAKTLKLLAQTSQEMDGGNVSEMQDMGEDMMKQMMAEFEKMGEHEKYPEVMENMLRQLLSKQLMYEPIKKVCEKYPEWLAAHKDELSVEDYNKYGKQYQTFQYIYALYETEPDNFSRLMELMQDLQEAGQVPAEIIRDLAPGLEFNQDGLPVMPSMGPGLVPNIPSFDGTSNSNCVLS